MRGITPPAPAAWPLPTSQSRSIEIPIRSLTPIFKAGARADRIDDGRPFRAPSIRGMLRYWWRATSTIATTAELRAAEHALFGGVHGSVAASQVSISVSKMQSRGAHRPQEPAYSYVFGVTGRAGNEHAVHLDAAGTLRLEWASGHQADVERALRAWLLFGGIGGRSRRGCGSVWWNGAAIGGTLAAPASVEDYLTAALALVPSATQAPLWPTLARGVIHVGPKFATADDAWRAGLAGMKDVRASQDVAPAVLMRLGRPAAADDWKQRDYIPIAAQRAWTSPRAALGLPIRFQGTAGNFMLEAASRDINRFPSPVHIKVISAGAREFHPIFVVVRTPMPGALKANQRTGQLDPAGLDTFIQLAARLPGWTRHNL